MPALARKSALAVVEDHVRFPERELENVLAACPLHFA